MGAGHARDNCIRQNLSYMAESQWHARDRRAPRKVQQATKVSAGNRARAARHCMREFLVRHRCRYLRQLRAEGPAEAAAHLRALHLAHRDPRLRQQRTGLSPDAEFPQARTTVVVAHGRHTCDGRGRVSHHAVQEMCEFVGSCRKRLRAFPPCGHVGEQAWVVCLDHARAGASGRHHVVIALETADEVLRERPRRGDGARVVAGLPAAGLLERHLDLATGALEQRDRCLCHRGAEDVHEAAHEKCHARALRRGGIHAGAS